MRRKWCCCPVHEPDGLSIRLRFDSIRDRMWRGSTWKKKDGYDMSTERMRVVVLFLNAATRCFRFSHCSAKNLWSKHHHLQPYTIPLFSVCDHGNIQHIWGCRRHLIRLQTIIYRMHNPLLGYEHSSIIRATKSSIWIEHDGFERILISKVASAQAITNCRKRM